MSEPQYEPLDLERQEEYRKRFAASPRKASDYSFANIWGWAEEYGLEWSFGTSHVFLRQNRPEPVYWAPVGPWDQVDWSGCPYLQSSKTFIRVPEELALRWKETFGERCELEEARGQWDYLYSIEELVELKGNKFHKKKNLFNQFLKSYEYKYMTMDLSCVEEALELQDEWCRWKECDSSALEAENTAVYRILQHWDRLPRLMGGAIHVDGRMVAYTVAEPLSEDTLVVHIEKARPDYKGVYQAINKLFLENDGKGYSLVNREQDMDEEGLRKAKLSYNPVDFLKKYTVKFS